MLAWKPACAVQCASWLTCCLALQVDNTMRAWYADADAAQCGLLFTSRQGCVDLARPVGEPGGEGGRAMIAMLFA